MAEELVNLGVRFQVSGTEAFMRGMQTAQKQGEQTRQSLSKTASVLKGMKTAWGGVNKVVDTAWVGVGKLKWAMLGVAGAAGLSAKRFFDFSEQMTRVETLLPEGVSAIDRFGTSVRDMSIDYARDTKEVSNALFEAISADVPAAKAEGFLKVVGEAAVAGFTDMKTVTDGLTGVMNAYGLSVDKARQISDVFFIANARGKVTIEELASFMGRVTPTASVLGVSYQEVAAALVAMTKAGVKTHEAVSSLRQVLGAIAGDKSAAKMAKTLGISWGASALQAKGFTGFLKEMTGAVGGNVDAQAQLFGSVEAFNAIAFLAADTGAAAYTNALKEMSGQTDMTGRMFARRADDIGFKIGQLKTAFLDLLISAGEGLVGGLDLGNVDKWRESLSKLRGEVKTAAGEFGRAFSKAFSPIVDAGNFDAKGFAQTLGEAAGTLAGAAVQLASALASLVSGLAEGAQSAANWLVGPPIQGAMTESQMRTHRADLTPWELTKDTAGPTPRTPRAYTLGGGYLGPPRARRDISPAEFVGRVRSVRDAVRKLAAHSAKGELTAVMRMESKQKGEKRLGERLTGYFQEGLGAVVGAQKAVGGALSNLWQVKIDQHSTQNFNDGTVKSTKSFGSRGRGDASIKSTMEQMYLIMDNKIIPMSDEFQFSHLLGESLS